MPSSTPPSGSATRDDTRRRLDGLVRFAQAAMLWERAWPRLWLPLAVVLLFLAASWLGLWQPLPPSLRQVGIALFVLALLASCWPLVRLRLPGRLGAIDRIDRTSPIGHRPARAIEDSLALGSEDPGARALWALHLRRAEAAMRDLKVEPPRPGLVGRDPFALRALVILAVIASAFVAGPEAGDRLRAAFDWRGPAAAAPLFRIDGWIDPPLYTHLPPLMVDLGSGQQHLKAPVGSTLVIRVAGHGDATITPGPGLAPLPSPEGPKPELREQRYKLTGNADVGIRTGLAHSLRLLVDAVPDNPPEISFASPPEETGPGAFTLSYKAKDDYGIAAAEAVVEKPQALADRRTLVPPPRIPLTVPGDSRSDEVNRTVAELGDSPWAGARVRLRLTARDEANQEGHSRTIEYTLPQRPFTQPLAKALVEQRRNLVLDPDHHRLVQVALDSLLIAPERFTPAWGVFLGLRTASERLRSARSDADLTDVADLLWAMAQQIEEGDLSDAERQLQAAQDRLRDAIDRGADDQEIKRLTEELKQAMDRFLREFAQKMEQNRQNGEQNQRAPDRVITQNDLNRMLNQMQDAMKRGDVAEAQRLLDQLKDILKNLRSAQNGSHTSDPMAREMSRQMDELDRMTRDQQQLRDETFRDGQQQEGQRSRRGQRPQMGQRGGGQRQPGQRQQGQQGQQGQDGEGDDQDQAENGQDGQQQGEREGQGLGQRQQALRQRLQELQRRMRGLGMQGEQGLSDAENAMRDAENALGQGDRGEAVDEQGRALEGLQRGMQGMAQQMQQMMGQGESGDQEGDPNAPGNPQGRAQNDPRNDDPLGRPTRSRDFSDGRVKVPTADESAVARARRILEELRRKLGDPNRPSEELDYFERLLKQQQ